jgi:GAF domain-containing protein
MEFLELLTPEVREYLAQNQTAVLESIRYIGVLVVPMRARGATVGTIGVFERRSSNPLTEKDIIWLQAVADRTGLAVDNAQLYEDAINRLERLDSLRSVGLAITSSPDLRLTLRVILDQVTDKLGVDAADVLLVDETDGMLAIAASAGFRSTAIPDYRLPMDECLPGQAVTGRRIETVTALSAFSQFRRRSLFAREGFKAYGAVPLIARTRLLGVLEVFHRAPLEPDPEWVAFLDALASEAAIAIDNAAMYERLQKVAPAGAPRKAGTAPELSRPEREILALVVEGATNSQIAQRVHLSQSTVKFHVHRLLQKADADTRTELARKATQEGWLITI